MEEWRDIEGYKGLYQVSNTGKVKSLERTVWNKGTGCYMTVHERILKGYDDGKGYLRVDLCKEGKVKQSLVHVLVATAFLDNPYNLPMINHRDENKENNNSENLEWCTSKYNNNYGTRTQRVAEKLSKPIFSIDKESGEIREFSSIMEASRQTGIDNRKINDCLKGRRKSAKGFYWHYADTEEVCNE